MVGRLYNICTYNRNRRPSIGPDCSEILRFLHVHPQTQISTGWNTQAHVWCRNRRVYLLVARPFVPQLRYCIVFSAPVMKGDWYLAGVRCLVPGSFSDTRPTLDFYRNLNCWYFTRGNFVGCWSGALCEFVFYFYFLLIYQIGNVPWSTLDTRFPRFPLRLLLHSQSGDRPGNNLAKFGSI
jgi:hypothetical protein